MGLPVTFLFGAAVLLLHDFLGDGLPRPPHLARLLPFLLLVPLPWILLRWFAARTLGRAAGSPAPRRLRLLAGLLPLSVPLAYAGIVLGGDLVTVASAWAGDSTLVFLGVALLPLLVMEVSYRLAERRVAVQAARRGLALLAPVQLALLWLVVVPILVMAACADLIQFDRGLHVFATTTALGHLCGFAVTVVAMSILLPLLFRFLLPTSRRLPPALAEDLRATAHALGFPPRALLSLRTDMRMANAAMVGPLPWPRYLVLTDALMALLDPIALRGVVAHEVGHARAGHPGLLLLLFVVVPVLAFHAVWLWLFDASEVATLGAMAAVAVAALLLLRLVAHRFEYEADQLSAQALGGAGPCIEALRRVGDLWVRGSERSTLRHPSDRMRIAQMLRWQADADERRRFARAGRRLRRVIGATVLAAAVACVWAQAWMWPIDRAQLAFYTGDFAQARERLATLRHRANGPLDGMVADLQREVEAAVTLAPEGGTWEEVRDRLAVGGLERGLQVLRDGDASAALPWLSLALSRPHPEPWRQTLYLIGRAAADGDQASLRELVQHIRDLGAPAEVAQVVEVVQARVPPDPTGSR
ncbi:MAG: M48 family metalloprotease [Planctomycetota bacterium]